MMDRNAIAPDVQRIQRSTTGLRSRREMGSFYMRRMEQQQQQTPAGGAPQGVPTGKFIPRRSPTFLQPSASTFEPATSATGSGGGGGGASHVQQQSVDIFETVARLNDDQRHALVAALQSRLAASSVNGAHASNSADVASVSSNTSGPRLPPGELPPSSAGAPAAARNGARGAAGGRRRRSGDNASRLIENPVEVSERGNLSDLSDAEEVESEELDEEAREVRESVGRWLDDEYQASSNGGGSGGGGGGRSGAEARRGRPGEGGEDEFGVSVDDVVVDDEDGHADANGARALRAARVGQHYRAESSASAECSKCDALAGKNHGLEATVLRLQEEVSELRSKLKKAEKKPGGGGGGGGGGGTGGGGGGVGKWKMGTFKLPTGSSSKSSNNNSNGATSAAKAIRDSGNFDAPVTPPPHANGGGLMPSQSFMLSSSAIDGTSSAATPDVVQELESLRKKVKLLNQHLDDTRSERDQFQMLYRAYLESSVQLKKELKNVAALSTQDADEFKHEETNGDATVNSDGN